MKTRNMERRRFGSTDCQAGEIGQGTWYLEADNWAAAIAAVRRGLDPGINHVDTAEYYGEARKRLPNR